VQNGRRQCLLGIGYRVQKLKRIVSEKSESVKALIRVCADKVGERGLQSHIDLIRKVLRLDWRHVSSFGKLLFDLSGAVLMLTDVGQH
jgi:hypothetical protein